MERSEELSNAVIQSFRQNRNEENRTGMEAYMKNQFKFFGIKSPQRIEILRPLWKEFQSISETERMETALQLFQQEERECHYAALALLDKGVKMAPRSAIGVYKELLMTASWWDTVDMISSNLCGGYFKQYPENLIPLTENWRHSSNMWVRRSSVLHQLKYKEATNEKLLFDTVKALKEEKEFFIEKAIGWALREYSKTNPQSVLYFLQSVECRPLSKREGLKWMKKKELV